MKAKQITVLFFLSFCTLSCAKGQAFQFVLPDFYCNRIKNISQFMERFSRNEIPPMIDSNDRNLPYIQVISCFLIDSIRNQKEEVLEFAQKMVDDNVTLDLHAPNYHCELDCKVKYAGRSSIVTLSLEMEQTPDRGYCWAITQAKGDVLQMLPNRVSPTMHISPVDNDMEFHDLLEILETHPEDLRNYTYSRLSVDETSIFLALVATQQLKLESIKDMRYVFQAGGYEFKVRRVDRETNNNGWLIYHFSKDEGN